MVKKKNKAFGGSFRGKTSKNAQKQQAGHYGYLNLPKGVNIFKVEDAGTRVALDIMPYVVKDPQHIDRDVEYEIAVPDSLWYKKPFYLHRNVGPNNDSVVCPGKGCPICAYRQELMDGGAEWDDDAVKALKASLRNLYAVIPIGSKKYPEEVHIWDVSNFLFQAKLNEEIQENEDYETFPDLEEGLTLHIRFSEEHFGKSTFYDTSRIDFKSRKTQYTEDILDDVPCLDDIVVTPSIEVVEAVFFGGESQVAATDDDDDEEQVGASSRAFTRRKRRADDANDDIPDPEPPPESDDDDDDDDDADAVPAKEEEASEEAPAPAKEKPSRRKKSKDTPSNKCPFGHVYGKDNDEHDDCDDCDVWEACLDAS